VKVRDGIDCLDIIEGVACLEFDGLWTIFANESFVVLDRQSVGTILHGDMRLLDLCHSHYEAPTEGGY
jgi:hypothetical protein